MSLVYGSQGKFTWRMLATVLAGQSILLFFGGLVARGMGVAAGAADADRRLWVGVGVALLAVLGAGLMRRPIGITVGWLVQVLTWLGALVVPMMVGVGVVFTALWVGCLRVGHRIDAERAASPALG